MLGCKERQRAVCGLCETVRLDQDRNRENIKASERKQHFGRDLEVSVSQGGQTMEQCVKDKSMWCFQGSGQTGMGVSQ